MPLFDMPVCDNITKGSRAERINRHGTTWTSNLTWWNEQLKKRGLPGMPLTGTRDGLCVNDGKGSITRGDVFELGKIAHTNPDAALSMLWHAVAWGHGLRIFGVMPILNSIAKERPGNALCEAAEMARTNPRKAYSMMISPNLIKYLGPSFATKYLYFAGGGKPAHPSAILDMKVAGVLKNKVGWHSLSDYPWSADDYQSYCDLLADWARTKSSEVEVGREVGGDEFELCLFEMAKS